MTKKITAIICVILALILFVIPFTTFGSSLFKETHEAEADLLQDGSFDISYDYNSASSSADSFDLFERYVYDELSGYSLKIAGLSEFEISGDDVYVMYSKVINDHPDLFYVSSSFTYTTNAKTGMLMTITPEYSIDVDEISEAQEIFNEGVAEILNLTDDSMDDIQKCLVVHDYICDRANYPDLGDLLQNPITKEYYYEYDQPWYHSAYGLFYDGNIVCAGYTLLYSYVLELLGIETEYVVSVEMNHSWNLVKINNSWYNVDLTYDDITGYGVNVDGAMMHRCFLASDDKIKTEECFAHYGGQNYGNHVASSKTYDYYFWEDITTNIPVINGEYYYISANAKHGFYITKRTKDGRTSHVYDKPFTYTYITLGVSIIVDEETIEFEIMDVLSRLVYMNGKLFFNSNRDLLCLSHNEADNVWDLHTIETVSDDYVYLSIGVNKNANIDYRLFDIPESYITAERELNKLDYYKKHISTPNSRNYFIYVDINNDKVINAKDYAMIIHNIRA